MAHVLSSATPPGSLLPVVPAPPPSAPESGVLCAAPSGSLPVAPTVEVWRAMAPAERERLLVEANEVLSDPRNVMAEGQPHRAAKGRALDVLRLYFRSIGRVVYLAEELAVHYPGEEVFAPDILAVLDVPEPEEDERLAWVVADERKGLDLALEVLYRGDRSKDLVKNVERYAKLGIPEYFVYDRMRQHLHGYRLPAPGAERYERIVPQLGRYRSAVLALDLAITGGRLRFFHGVAELIGTADLIGRLEGMVEDLEARAEQAEARAEQERALAEQERALAEQAEARAEQERAQAQQALAGLRASILALLGARGLPCPDEARARVASCGDVATLQRWLLRATTAGAVEEVFAG